MLRIVVPGRLAASHEVAMARALVGSTALVSAPPARIIDNRVFHIIAGPGSVLTAPVRGSTMTSVTGCPALLAADAARARAAGMAETATPSPGIHTMPIEPIIEPPIMPAYGP